MLPSKVALCSDFQQFKDAAKPEAAYFVADGGERTTYFFFDLKQPRTSRRSPSPSSRICTQLST